MSCKFRKKCCSKQIFGCKKIVVGKNVGHKFLLVNFLLQILSIWVKLRLHTKNWYPEEPGSDLNDFFCGGWVCKPIVVLQFGQNCSIL